MKEKLTKKFKDKWAKTKYIAERELERDFIYSWKLYQKDNMYIHLMITKQNNVYITQYKDYESNEKLISYLLWDNIQGLSDIARVMASFIQQHKKINSFISLLLAYNSYKMYSNKSDYNNLKESIKTFIENFDIKQLDNKYILGLNIEIIEFIENITRLPETEEM